MTILTYTQEPSFHHTQRVSFLGGEGIIRNCQRQAETWLYVIEMSLGPEPNFGRVGAETMILLNETDLCAV